MTDSVGRTVSDSVRRTRAGGKQKHKKQTKTKQKKQTKKVTDAKGDGHVRGEQLARDAERDGRAALRYTGRDGQPCHVG